MHGIDQSTLPIYPRQVFDRSSARQVCASPSLPYQRSHLQQGQTMVNQGCDDPENRAKCHGNAVCKLFRRIVTPIYFAYNYMCTEKN